MSKPIYSKSSHLIGCLHLKEKLYCKHKRKFDLYVSCGKLNKNNSSAVYVIIIPWLMMLKVAQLQNLLINWKSMHVSHELNRRTIFFDDDLNSEIQG